MKIRGIILFTTLLLSTIVLTTSFKIMNNKVEKNPSIELSKLGNSDLSSPTPLKMYELIDHYSDIYEIPKPRAFKTLFKTIKFYINQFEKWGKLDSCCENLTTGYMCRYRWKKIRSRYI